MHTSLYLVQAVLVTRRAVPDFRGSILWSIGASGARPAIREARDGSEGVFGIWMKTTIANTHIPRVINIDMDRMVSRPFSSTEETFSVSMLMSNCVVASDVLSKYASY